MMRTVLFAGLAAVAMAAPAQAQIRAEARGGLISVDGTGEAVLGAAAGIDVPLTPLAFAGVEVSADTIQVGPGQTVWGLTGRLGVKLPGGTRLYGTGGRSSEACTACQGQWHAGGGVQQPVLGPVYLKAEYRHFFPNGSVIGTDAVAAGVGVRF